MKKHLQTAVNALMVTGIAIAWVAAGVQIIFLIETNEANFSSLLGVLTIPIFLVIVAGFSFINQKQHKQIMGQINDNSQLREELWAQTALSEGLEARDKAMQGLLSALTSYIVQNASKGQETIEIINPATGEKATITIKPVEKKPE